MKKYFQFEELGTNYRSEIIGGITTFLAMAYILVVNPITLTLSRCRIFLMHYEWIMVLYLLQQHYQQRLVQS